MAARREGRVEAQKVSILVLPRVGVPAQHERCHAAHRYPRRKCPGYRICHRRFREILRMTYSAPLRRDLVQSFLQSRGWVRATENQQITEYRPPVDLGLGERFAIALPANADSEDAQLILRAVTESLAVIYTIPVHDLRATFATAD